MQTESRKRSACVHRAQGGSASGEENVRAAVSCVGDGLGLERRSCLKAEISYKAIFTRSGGRQTFQFSQSSEIMPTPARRPFVASPQT